MDEHQFVALDETHSRDICSWRSLQRDRAILSSLITPLLGNKAIAYISKEWSYNFLYVFFIAFPLGYYIPAWLNENQKIAIKV